MTRSNVRDRELGMDRPISRRDFLHGLGALAAAASVPGCATDHSGTAVDPPAAPYAYPPALTGLRGSGPGSFEVAHQLALQGRSDWGPVRSPDDSVYDLVVVGSGISGLAAAYFHLQREPGARILILDNHDDFGGHARRNEFQVGGRTVIGYGGSQTLEEPETYTAVSQQLLRDIGIALEQLDRGYDRDFYRAHGLRGGVYFDRATYGVDRLVPYEVVEFSGYLPLTPSELSPEQAVARMPLSEPARKQLLPLLADRTPRITDVPPEKQADYLEGISYRTFLERYYQISEPEIFAMLEGVSTDVGVTIETAPALYLLNYVGLPGFFATSLPYVTFDDVPYTAHFPDGNASIARLLVRAMVPRVAPGSTMLDVVDAPFDYGRLDEPDAPVRVRLSSCVVNVAHEGLPQSAETVAVTYVREGRAERVRARGCVLACYNAIIPHLCPDMPEPQRKALSLAVKSPILYSTVALRDWRAWKAVGIAAASAPGSYHNNAMLDFPVSLGDIRYAADPEDPILVHMERFGKAKQRNLPPREQYRAVRRELLTTPVRVHRARDPHPAGRHALRGRLRPGARHRGGHGQPLGSRLRVWLQPAVR